MLPKTMIRLVLTLLLMQHSLVARTPAAEAGQFRVEARVLGEEYCRGDADLYTVSVKVDVEVFNTSGAPSIYQNRWFHWAVRWHKALRKQKQSITSLKGQGPRFF